MGKATVPSVTGAGALGFFAATVFSAWQYPESTFGKFSASLGITIASVLVGIWGADFYHRKDANRKRYRDVEVSVYTTWLIMVGVETVLKHITNARENIAAFSPVDESGHNRKLKAHSEIEAGNTAAELTIKMAYLTLTHLSSFSAEAVKAGKEKFANDEQEAGVRQQIRAGAAKTATPDSQAKATAGNGSMRND